MKEKLKKLYNDRVKDFVNVVETFPEDDLSGPFLMSPNKKYENQKIKLLIVGQETAGWSYYVQQVDEQMKFYEDFNLGSEYYSSPFWNITRKVERALGNEEYSCAWTNISKFDLDGGRSHGEFEQKISEIDSILIDEIEILSPKICLFFTGPSFDKRLENIFKGIKFVDLPNWKGRQFSKLVHPLIPENTYRSYHPNFLRRSKLEDQFIDFVASIKIQ